MQSFSRMKQHKMSKSKIIVVMSVLVCLILSSCNRHIVQLKEAKQYYYNCPMHPTYVSDKPGICPKCGMTLELINFDKTRNKNTESSHSGFSGSSGHSGGHH